MEPHRVMERGIPNIMLCNGEGEGEERYFEPTPCYGVGERRDTSFMGRGEERYQLYGEGRGEIATLCYRKGVSANLPHCVRSFEA